jgi:phosphopantetheinyl transferase (holo-ACP synthase)
MQTGTAPPPAHVRLVLARQLADDQPTPVGADTRLQRFRTEERRQSHLITRALLASHAPAATTSLAHSEGVSVVGWCDQDTGFGVDVECCRPRDVLRLARFSFAPAELAQLEALDPPDRQERFYALWVLKEACAKALRWPLLQALRDCEFVSVDGVWQGRLPGHWQLRVLAPSQDVRVGVAVASRAVALHCAESGRADSVNWPVRVHMSM